MCLGNVIQLPMGISGPQRSEGQQYLGVFLKAPVFYPILSMISECRVQFHGVCKAGRIYMAKNLLIY